MKIQSLFVLLLTFLLLTGCAFTPGQTDPLNMQTAETELTVSESMRDYNAQNKYRGVAPRSFSFQETDDFSVAAVFLERLFTTTTKTVEYPVCFVQIRRVTMKLLIVVLTPITVHFSAMARGSAIGLGKMIILKEEITTYGAETLPV